jgi:hypothetical protein
MRPGRMRRLYAMSCSNIVSSGDFLYPPAVA